MHADAAGRYSSFDNGVGSRTFMRGIQRTDAKGLAIFKTVYPGWYHGRTVHIHVKVHIGGAKGGTTYSGGHVSHTGQLFFNDAISGQVYALDPYASDKALFTIDAKNVDKYKDNLTVGQVAMIKKYPDYKIVVYPTHRSAAAPQAQREVHTIT